MHTRNEHWNTVFSTTSDSQLGWYEKDISQTLKFIDQIPKSNELSVFLPGAGTSILVDKLLHRGYNLILNDISDEALTKLKNRIGTNTKATWLHHDMSKPLPNHIPKVNIWIDRAVLHFLLNEEDIQTYFANLQATITQDGYVLLAEFALSGAPKCAGLEVHRYSIEELTTRMGSNFKLVEHEEYTYTNPFGNKRPYVYGLYKRI